jgi:hypothetical protein
VIEAARMIQRACSWIEDKTRSDISVMNSHIITPEVFSVQFIDISNRIYQLDDEGRIYELLDKKWVRIGEV